MNKKLLCQLIYDLESSGKIEQAEEIQNLMDLYDIAIDSIYKIDKIKNILGIKNESD